VTNWLGKGEPLCLMGDLERNFCLWQYELLLPRPILCVKHERVDTPAYHQYTQPYPQTQGKDKVSPTSRRDFNTIYIISYIYIYIYIYMYIYEIIYIYIYIYISSSLYLLTCHAFKMSQRPK
jgi:hypothetical protein